MAETTEFPYSPVPNNLRKLLAKFPDMGTPPKATQAWLAGVGFSGGNNNRNLAVMRQVGIISASGEPSELWAAVRGKDKAKFAAGLRRHYSGLFNTYPDAHRKDDEALLAYIRSNTDYGERAQKYAVRVFKVLCEFGDFGAEPDPDDPLEEEDEPNDGGGESGGRRRRKSKTAAASGGGVALTLNIQIQLPPSGDGEVYDKVFEAMGRHLKTLIQPEPDEQ
jgi:hypothetical protein